ncbi:unnamed protein product [Paramecium octaurelia]|uniref:Uncharacterized protein n=1 Tax=Paramecium octaurelia TaxID=43137 RepID=A0A8S1TAQ5_PAROT|nr:unnamed protein product [Paramecium octaurelia]
MKTFVIFAILLASIILPSTQIELNNQNVVSDCECLGQFNCPCGNKDILYVMRSGQDRLMFRLNNKEKEYINELNKESKQKQKHK